MPTTTLKPRTRKIKEPEQPLYWEKALESFQSNRTAFLVGTIVILALAAGCLAYYFYSQRWEQEAWQKYEEALAASHPSSKIELLRYVVDKYPGTTSGGKASFLLAAALYDEGKQDEAEKAYRSFLEKNPRSYLAPAAWEALGHIAEDRNDFAQAVTCYQHVIDEFPQSYIVNRVLMDQGRSYERLNKPDEALKAYNQAAQSPEWSEEAKERIEVLQAQQQPVATPAVTIAPAPQETVAQP